ncbi:MAG: M20/M25/M40 family metallo-hydrolase [Desulfuromonadales bacterium]|nr:M20/M25/M40 family metallo-hydrolase [Desulfuromonadales bacterium]
MILTILVLTLLALAGVLLHRAWRLGGPAAELPAPADHPVDAEAAIGRLAALLRVPTISWQESERFDPEAFRQLHRLLAQEFPRVHAALQQETIAGLSLLYSWPGSEPSLAPILLMAHQDVVPVPSETAGEWSHPPFGGEIADGFLWGRGALDFKSALAAILEGAETLLAAGFQPRRTIYLAFGHDEEVGGAGNRAIAAELAQRGIRLALVLDEGGSVVERIVPGVVGPVALIGIAEKGYLSLELTARGEGGHSSMPPAETAIGTLAQALRRLEERPFPARLDLVGQMFAALGCRLSFPYWLIFANLWLFAPLAVWRLSRMPATNAALRTTVVPTLLYAGVKENLLPQAATATVNLRLMPGETVAQTIDRVKEIIADPRLEIRPGPIRSEASPVADHRSPAFALLARSIRQVDPQSVVAPFLVVGATDSRHYAGLADQVLRFAFLHLGPDDLKRIHGTDERIHIADYRQMVRFFIQLLENLQEL